MPFPAIDPIALSIGPIDVRWYGLAYALGIILGLFYARYLARRYPDFGTTAKEVEDAVPWIVLGVIVGGRLGSVLFYNFEYYRSHPVEIFYLHQGGMSFHGGLLGVGAALALYCRLRRLNLFAVADLISCVVPIGLGLGRIANFVNGELWGRVTGLPWGVRFPGAGDLPRHPSQLYEAALEGLLLLVLLRVLAARTAFRQSHGGLAGAFLLGYGAIRMAVEFVREPDGALILGMTRGQFYSAPMVLLGASLLVWSLSRARSAGVARRAPETVSEIRSPG